MADGSEDAWRGLQDVGAGIFGHMEFAIRCSVGGGNEIAAKLITELLLDVVLQLVYVLADGIMVEGPINVSVGILGK